MAAKSKPTPSRTVAKPPKSAPAKSLPTKAKSVARKAESAATQELSMALGMDHAALEADIRRHLSYTLGRDAHAVSNRYRYIATVIGDPRPPDGALEGDPRRVLRRRLQARLLPVDGVPDGPRASGTALLNLGVDPRDRPRRCAAWA